MPKSLRKTSRRISNKRGGDVTALHENSRDSRSLRRAGGRDDKLERMAAERKRHNRPTCMDFHETMIVWASIDMFDSGSSSVFSRSCQKQRREATRTRCDT